MQMRPLLQSIVEISRARMAPSADPEPKVDLFLNSIKIQGADLLDLTAEYDNEDDSDSSESG